jgi:hypothetical protein
MLYLQPIEDIVNPNNFGQGFAEQKFERRRRLEANPDQRLRESSTTLYRFEPTAPVRVPSALHSRFVFTSSAATK